MIPILLQTSDALACGGFFCSTIPIDQSGEDVLFVVDEERDETTVHVQISYTGEAADFAWVVPVAQVPEIVLSTDEVFRDLSATTYPSFITDMVGLVEGICDSADLHEYQNVPSPPPASEASVIAQSTVGPYDTVTLRARSSDELLAWLQSNGYDLPPTLDAVLAPYIAEESYFVALKLSKGESVGALQPIALRYPGTGMSIPLQLTSIAATPDMPIRVGVLAPARAVPDSYLHVTIDEIRFSWWASLSGQIYDWNTPETSSEFYSTVVPKAIDEAGGHAFVTDYAASAAVMSERLWLDSGPTVEMLAAAATPYEAVDILVEMGLFGDGLLIPIFQEFLPMPPELAEQGYSTTSFYGCLQCFSELVDLIPFDAAAFAARVDERLITPRRTLQDAFDSIPWLTLLSTALSPDEMTLDPTFVLNRDLPQTVSAGRASLEHVCFGSEGDFTWDEAPLRFELPDGRSYDLPSESDMRAMETTPLDLLAPLRTRYVSTVEDLGATGPGVLLVDNRDIAQQEADLWNENHPWETQESGTSTDGTVDPGLEDIDAPKEAVGCGCDGVSRVSRGTLLVMLAGVLSLRRRR